MIRLLRWLSQPNPLHALIMLCWRLPQYSTGSSRYCLGVQTSLKRLSFACSQLLAGIAETVSNMLACTADAPRAVATLSASQDAFAECRLRDIRSPPPDATWSY